MSYHIYSVEGFGVCIDDIDASKVTFDSIRNLCSLSESLFEDWFKLDISNYGFNAGIFGDENLDFETKFNMVKEQGNPIEFLETVEGKFCEPGICAYLLKVIKDKEDIVLTFASDFDDKNYLLVTPYYSWSVVSEAERNLTEDSAREIFKKYIKIVFDEDVSAEYCSVENGG